jgi:hypothetical protein
VLFEVKVGLTKWHIPPNFAFDFLEVERSDYLPLYGCVQ